MARVLGLFSFKTFQTAVEYTTVYVPLSAKQIPLDQLEHTIRGWFHPDEFDSVPACLSLVDAIDVQRHNPCRERYPHTEAVRVILELQVPSNAVVTEDNQTRIDLILAMGELEITNIYLTAKFMPGLPQESHLEGDLPFDGRIHEELDINQNHTLFTTR